MLMNLVNLLINHLLGRTSTAEAPAPGLFPNFTLASVRKVAMILAGFAGALVLFFGGFFTVLLDLTLTSRDHQELMLSPASIVGFALIGVSCLLMAGLFSRRMWKVAPQQMRQEIPVAPSPVQEALAVLIHDFVEERRMGRAMMAEQMAAEVAAAAAAMEATSPRPSEAESTPYPSHPIYN